MHYVCLKRHRFIVHAQSRELLLRHVTIFRLCIKSPTSHHNLSFTFVLDMIFIGLNKIKKYTQDGICRLPQLLFDLEEFVLLYNSIAKMISLHRFHIGYSSITLRLYVKTRKWIYIWLFRKRHETFRLVGKILEFYLFSLLDGIPR